MQNENKGYFLESIGYFNGFSRIEIKLRCAGTSRPQCIKCIQPVSFTGFPGKPGTRIEYQIRKAEKIAGEAGASPQSQFNLTMESRDKSWFLSVSAFTILIGSEDTGYEKVNI